MKSGFNVLSSSESIKTLLKCMDLITYDSVHSAVIYMARLRFGFSLWSVLLRSHRDFLAKFIFAKSASTAK